MKNDPNYDDYLKIFSTVYEGKHYDEGLSGFFLSRSHAWCESKYRPHEHFSRVVEVGAGSGVHLKSVRHSFDDYIVTDLNQPMLDRCSSSSLAKRGNITAQIQNASDLTLDTDSVDRLVATHVLEHLYKPHEVLREWNRVVKPGGVISILLPCDPGVAWRLGRRIGVRKKMIAAGILDYDYWMAREHVNPINNLIALIRFYFKEVEEEWYPFHIPSIDLNLFYVAHIRASKCT